MDVDFFSASSVLSVLPCQLRLHVGSHIPLFVVPSNDHSTRLQSASIPESPFTEGPLEAATIQDILEMKTIW